MKSLLRAASLTTLFVFTSSTVLSAPAESSLWESRRRQRDVSLALAGGSPGAALVGALPAVRSVPALEPRSAAIVPSSDAATGLRRLVAALPQGHVSVRDLRDAGPGRPVVAIIQDVHLNPEAQENIAAALARLSAERAVDRVGVEGAFDPLDFTRLDGFTDRALVAGVADDFLKAGLLAAPSRAGLGLDPSLRPSFVGVDDRAAHERNVAAYLAGVALRPRFDAAAGRLRSRLAALKSRHYSPPLLELDAAVAAHRDGRLGAGPYLSRLSAVVKPTAEVAAFLEAWGIESRLDFNRVETERRRVVERLAAALPAPELRDLLDRTVAFRTGRFSLGEFHGALGRLCRSHGINIDATPAFADYLRYVLIADRLSPERLMGEAAAMERRAFDRLADQSVQRVIARLSERLSVIERMAAFALTPDEWERYRGDSVPMSELAAAVAGLDGEPAPPPVPLESFEDFYREADVRSGVIVSRLLDGDPRSAVLVAGGFHTPHLATLLRNRGCSVVVCTPKLTKADPASGSAYLTIFSREKAPIERLFAGERLFINPASVNIGSAALERDLVAEAAARAVEDSSAGRLPPGVQSVRDGSMIRVVVDGIVVFFGRAARAAGFVRVAGRVGRDGSRFVRAPSGVRRAAAALAMASLAFLSMGAKGGDASSLVALVALVGVPLAIVVIVRRALRPASEVERLISIVRTGVMEELPEAQVWRLIPTDGLQNWTPRPNTLLTAVARERRLVQVAEGEMVILEVEPGRDAALLSENHLTCTSLQLRAVHPETGRILIAHLHVLPRVDHFRLVSDGLKLVQKAAAERGYRDLELAANWSPGGALTGRRTGEPASENAFRNALGVAADGARIVLKSLDTRRGTLNAMVTPAASIRSDVPANAAERTAGAPSRTMRTAWTPVPSNAAARRAAAGRFLRGAAAGSVAGLMGIHVGIPVAWPLILAISAVIVGVWSAAFPPLAPRTAPGGARETPAPSVLHLPTPDQLSASNVLVLSPTYREGDQLRRSIRAMWEAGYLDRVVFINDGSSDLDVLSSLKADGLPGLQADENDRFRRSLFFVSFDRNQRKEGAIRSTLAFLSSRYGSDALPPVTVIQDSDSVLAGREVRAGLEAGAVDLLAGGHAAAGVRIEGALTRRSPIVAWIEGITWYLYNLQKRAHEWVERRAPFLRRFLSRGVAGGAALFRTDRLVAALAEHSGHFEAGDIELARRIVEAELAAGNPEPIGRMLPSLTLRTDVMATLLDAARQKSRWITALFDEDPAIYAAMILMLVVGIVGSAHVFLHPAVLGSLVLMTLAATLARGLHVAVAAVTGRDGRLRAGPLSPMTWVVLPLYPVVMLGVFFAAMAWSLYDGLRKRLASPDDYPPAWGASALRWIADAVSAVRRLIAERPVGAEQTPADGGPRPTDGDWRSERDLKIREMTAAATAVAESGGAEALVRMANRHLAIYPRLPEFAARVLVKFRALAARNRLYPGEIRLTMVGGRVRGTPLKEDSDIDLIFSVENAGQSFENFYFDRFEDPLDAQEHRNFLRIQVNDLVRSVVAEMGIPHEFHTLSMGAVHGPEVVAVNDGRLLLERNFPDESGSAGPDDVARAIIGDARSGDAGAAFRRLINLFALGTAPSIRIGEMLQGRAPLAAFDPMDLARAIGRELGAAVDRGELTPEQANAVGEVLAALLASAAGAGRASAPIAVDKIPDASDGKTPLDQFRWLSPNADEALEEAGAAVTRWRAGEARADDRLVLLAPAEAAERIRRTLESRPGGLSGVLIREEGSFDSVTALLDDVGGLRPDVVGLRRLRFLVRNDSSLPPGFFDLAAAGLGDGTTEALRRNIEVYLIVSAVAQAIRIDGTLLPSYEALRAVMIQA